MSRSRSRPGGRTVAEKHHLGVNFWARDQFSGQRRFCFLAWQYPLGVIAIPIVSARVRAWHRGRANRGRANEVQPRSRLMVPRAHPRGRGGCVLAAFLLSDMRRRLKPCQATRDRLASLAAPVTPILRDLPLTVAFSRSKATQQVVADTGRHFSPVLRTTEKVTFRQ